MEMKIKFYWKEIEHDTKLDFIYKLGEVEFCLGKLERITIHRAEAPEWYADWKFTYLMPSDKQENIIYEECSLSNAFRYAEKDYMNTLSKFLDVFNQLLKDLKERDERD